MNELLRWPFKPRHGLPRGGIAHGLTLPVVMGYHRTTQRGKRRDPAYHAYADWKAKFRLFASAVGIPRKIEKGWSASVDVTAEWKAVARIDIDNVAKAVLDSLWGQDRRVLAICARAVEHTKNDLLQVIVTLYPSTEGSEYGSE